MKESTPLTPASPAQPVAAYIGRKRNLADLVIRRIRRTPHDLYAEPFVGMGGIFQDRRHAGIVLPGLDRAAHRRGQV